MTIEYGMLACRRMSGVILAAPNVPPKEIELVDREILEMRDALEAFEVAVEAGETTGFRDSGIKSQSG